jgi:hypothetical protein
MRRFFAAGFVLCALSVNAQETTFKFPNLFEEVGGGMRARNRHRENGTLQNNQLQYRFFVKVGIPLTPDGKLKVRARIASGSKFESMWDETGIGTNTERNLKMVPRDLFVEYTPSKALFFQAGSLPVMADQIKGKAVQNIDVDGSFIGARAGYSGLNSWANQIVVSVGEMDDFTQPNVLKADFSKPNFLQVHVQGKISKRFSHVFEATSFEDSEYVRAMVETSVKDVLGFLADSIVVEELIQAEGEHHQGFSASAKKAIGTWHLLSQYSFRGSQIGKSSPQNLILDDQYNLSGHSIGMDVKKTFGNWTASAFAGKVVNKTKFFSLQGARFDAIVSWSFKSKK